MKAKKLAPVLSLVLCLSCLSGCTGNQKVTFQNYWHKSPLETKEALHETLVYDVSFEEANGLSSIGYGLSYSNGKYKTELIREESNGKTVYCYTTQLTITATYTLGNETAVFEDSVTTETRFYEALYNLQPISSHKEIVSSSPNNGGNFARLEDCYETYAYTVTTTYNENGSEGTCKVTEKDGEPVSNTFEIEDKKYSYLDNDQLLFALRGISSDTSAAKLLVYSPFIEAMQTVSLTYSAAESANFTFSKNGENQQNTITYRPVSIVLDEINPGATQTAWIAKESDTQTKNDYRNVVLRLETPLSYSLGKLIYKLNSVSYQ